MKKNRVRKINVNNILIYGLFVCISLISLGYSALSVTFSIKASAVFRVDEEVRLTDAVLTASENGGYENFNVKYSKDELISNVTLLNFDSTLTYTLTITNYSTKIMKVDSVKTDETTNSNIKYEINGCNVEDIIPAGSSINCTVKFYNDNGAGTTDVSSIIHFSFAELISNDATLANLSVDGYTLSPPFVPEIENYSVTTEATNINVNAIVNNEKATVTGDGQRSLIWGENNLSVIVIAEDGTEKTYTINVNNIKPTAPVITGGSSSWASTEQTISISTSGDALSGVSHYEYFISDEIVDLNDETQPTGTTTDDLIITDSGTSYVYYRTVSKNGNKSEWSNEQVVNIDNVSPDGNISASASYSGSTATVTFSVTTNDEHSGVNKYLIYYKKSTDSTYSTTTSKNITGQSGITYQYYMVITDNMGYTKTTDVQSIKLKIYGQSGLYCDYTYGNYTSTTTNDVASCTAVEKTDTGETYTECALGNWPTTPTTTTQTNSCTPVLKTEDSTSYTECTQNEWNLVSSETGLSECTAVEKTDEGTSYTACTLDSDWTNTGSSNVNSCSASETSTAKVTCSTNSWSSSSSQTNSCTASGSSSSNTTYTTCTENGWGSGTSTYVTSCTASTKTTSKVECTSGYKKVVCTYNGTQYSLSCTSPCQNGSYSSCTSGYYKKVTYTRSYKYTKKVYTRSSKYKKTNYVKYYTKEEYARDYAFLENVYNRLYNQTVYTRTKTANTCWYDE